MLLGPGNPRWAVHHSYPHHAITIYFLPIILFEMGPNGDGAWRLSRFTRPTLINQRVISPPRKLGTPSVIGGPSTTVASGYGVSATGVPDTTYGGYLNGASFLFRSADLTVSSSRLRRLLSVASSILFPKCDAPCNWTVRI
jgi:hypothetical protein